MIDPLADVLGYQLRRASLVIMGDFNARLASLKLNATMASTLLFVEENAGAKLIAIGQCLEIKRANITPIITELEKRGLIERSKGGRSHALTLTKMGIDMVRKVRQSIADSELGCFGHLDETARQTLKALLLSIRAQSTHANTD